MGRVPGWHQHLDKADVVLGRSIITVNVTQVIDEGSTDGTVERLEEAGVAVLRAPEPHGLTQSWNLVRRPPIALRAVAALGLQSSCAANMCSEHRRDVLPNRHFLSAPLHQRRSAQCPPGSSCSCTDSCSTSTASPHITAPFLCLHNCFCNAGWRRLPSQLCATAQAYDHWLRGTHVYLFIVNNDVLVPSGVLTKLMHAMREDGEALAIVMSTPPAPP